MDEGRSVARVQAHREAILARAIEVFAEEGFRDADVQRIAEKAGVGYGTVYRHFCTKEQLFWAATYVVLERLGTQVREALRHACGAVEALRAAGLAYVGFFQANPECLAIFVESRAEFRGQIPASHREFHEKTMQLFVEILDRGIAEEEIRPFDVRGVVTSFGSVLYGIAMFGCYVQDQCPLSDLARQTLDIFLTGISASGVQDKPRLRDCDVTIEE